MHKLLNDKSSLSRTNPVGVLCSGTYTEDTISTPINKPLFVTDTFDIS